MHYSVILSTGIKSRLSNVSQFGYPLSLLFAAAIVSQKKLNTKLLDLYALDIREEEFAEIVAGLETDVWGITCNVTDRFEAFKAAEIVKRVKPGIVVVIGGMFASYCYQSIMEDIESIDIVVRGEGEFALEEIIRAAPGRDFSSIAGISWRKDGTIVHNPDRAMIVDLNTLPPPDYSLLDMERYYNKKSRYFESDELSDVYEGSDIKVAELMFGRGCPFDCMFCCSKEHFYRRYRIITPENAVAQIKSFYDKGFRFFIFWDDHLLLNKKWFNKFYEEIKYQELSFTFKMSSRVDAIREEDVIKLREIGCRYILLGIEYGEDETLDFIGKKITTQQIENLVSLLVKYGIKVGGGMICNFPHETEEKIDKSIAFFKKLEKYWPNQQLNPHPVQVYPGSNLDKTFWKERYPDFRWTQPYFRRLNAVHHASPFVPIWENVSPFVTTRRLMKSAYKNRKVDTLKKLIDHTLLHADTRYLTFADRTWLKIIAGYTLLIESVKNPGFTFYLIRFVIRRLRGK